VNQGIRIFMNLDDWRRSNPFFIKSIEITGLLGRFDIKWELSDVNVLVGKNGSGKSTIIKLVEMALSTGDEQGHSKHPHSYDILSSKFSNFEIELNNGQKSSLSSTTDSEQTRALLKIISTLFENNDILERLKDSGNEDSYNTLQIFKDTISGNKSVGELPKSIITAKSNIAQGNGSKKLKDIVSIDFLSTFDMLLLSREQYDEYSGESYSQLDVMIKDEMGILKSNLLTLNYESTEEYKKEKKTNSNKQLSVIQANKFSKVNIFKKEINTLFKDEGKSFDIEKTGELSVKYHGKELPISTLSSGEKQLLIIMVKVLNSALKNPSIIIMDEPEISLHVSWQQQLITTIRKISPQSQIIIVSHSPAVVMKHWMNKVVDIKELILEK